MFSEESVIWVFTPLAEKRARGWTAGCNETCGAFTISCYDLLCLKHASASEALRRRLDRWGAEWA